MSVLAQGQDFVSQNQYKGGWVTTYKTPKERINIYSFEQPPREVPLKYYMKTNLSKGTLITNQGHQMPLTAIFEIAVIGNKIYLRFNQPNENALGMVVSYEKDMKNNIFIYDAYNKKKIRINIKEKTVVATPVGYDRGGFYFQLTPEREYNF